jgi:hypothetical protein
MLQARRSWVRISIRSLNFSIDLGSTASSGNEYWESSWGVKGRPVRKADNFTTICELVV